MAYNFNNPHKIYRQSFTSSQNSKSYRDSINKYQYKLEKPKNAILMKSIYTEDESQFFRLNTNEDENRNDDIYEFIENSKTLKEKIVQKLQKRKRNNPQRTKIIQTTFRPTQPKFNNTKQNRISNNITARKSLNKQKYSKNNPTTERKRILTQIQQANALWEDRGYKAMSQLDFYERQQKTLTSRNQFINKQKQQRKDKQLQGCTFKPKLTNYKPLRKV